MQLRQDRLTWHVVGENVVVLDLDGSVYLQVNGSGRLLWESLAESASEDELVATLVEHYGIESSRAAADVESFLAEVRRRDLLAD
jgi:hypothetical protein